MRVLLVEDDTQLRELTAKGLRHASFAVDAASDGAEALHKTEAIDYDVVVLDRDLPEVHGDDVCARLAERDPRPRIIMLTAFTEIADRVDGLSLGADDYLPKPFAMSELVARVTALARRTPSASPPVLAAQDLTVNTGSRTVTRRGGDAIALTPKEYGVLVELLRAAPNVVSAELLLERVWDENADPFTNAVRVTMANLRRKLGHPELITTKVGAGYSIEC